MSARPDYLLPAIEALLFVASVYLQKFARRKLRLFSKQYKEVSRIGIVSALTLVLMAYNYQQKCQPLGIQAQQCFYFGLDLGQCVLMLVANTILFGYHLFVQADWRRLLASLRNADAARKVLFAPLLEELLFRAVFYRSGNGSISIVYLSAVFSLAHLHKHVRKAISGKSRGVRVVLFQLVFTFVFSLYAYYFLQRFQSVVPCILLHCYCNIIGPPVVRKKQQLVGHSVCLGLFLLFTAVFV